MCIWCLEEGLCDVSIEHVKEVIKVDKRVLSAKSPVVKPKFRYSLKERISDITIQCGNKVFKASKNVLSARSPVFKAMFSHDMKEKLTNIVVIEDIDPSDFRIVLSFIYGKYLSELEASTTCNLMYAAEKYQMSDLKTRCAQLLKSTISVRNMFHIWKFADLFDKKLQKYILNFISKY